MDSHLFRILVIGVSVAFLIFFCLLLGIIRLCRQDPPSQDDRQFLTIITEMMAIFSARVGHRMTELQKVAREKKRTGSEKSTAIRSVSSAVRSQRNSVKDNEPANVPKSVSETASAVADLPTSPARRKNSSLANLFPWSEMPHPIEET